MDDALINVVQQLSDRLAALEHTVNDTIIGGWKKADEEYKDQEAFKAFGDRYNSELEPLKPYFVKLYGEDFDLPHSIYDELKKVDGYGTDNFDEASLMKAKIDELKGKFDGWNLEDKVEEAVEEAVPDTEVEVAEVKEDEVPTVEALKELYKKTIGE